MHLALSITALALTLGPNAGSAAPDEDTTRGSAITSRVLIVDIDDMGFDLLRAAPTPTLDWLEANGRFFTSFTAEPLCTPSRAVMNMGVYSSDPDMLVGGNIPPGSAQVIDFPGLRSMAQRISNAGLRTAKVGKWHLSGDLFPSHPNDLGWSDYRGALGNLGINSGGFEDFRKVTNGVREDLSGIYCTTDETNDAIARVVDGYELISLSYHAPHAPFHEPPAHLHTIAPIVDDLDRARAMLQACDRELGRLLREALPRGYTVLVYGDNGTSTVIGGEKGTLRDGGILVPFWAIGPGVLPGVDGSRISVVDIYATVAELLGVSAGGPSRGRDSRSFARALRGAGEYRRWTYAERFGGIKIDPNLGQFRWRRAVRGDRYKLIFDSNGDVEVLYDLANDPGETADLLTGPPLDPEATAALAYLREVLTRI